jgi:hypothetical protein
MAANSFKPVKAGMQRISETHASNQRRPGNAATKGRVEDSSKKLAAVETGAIHASLEISKQGRTMNSPVKWEVIVGS